MSHFEMGRPERTSRIPKDTPLENANAQEEMVPSREQIFVNLEGEGVHVESSPAFEPPTTDLSHLQIADKAAFEKLEFWVKSGVEVCAKFLNGAIITDSFGTDHTSRREWEDGIRGKYGQAYIDVLGANKLGRNNIAKVQTAVRRLGDSLKTCGVEPEAVTALEALQRQCPDMNSYNLMPLEEKVAVVHAYEDIARSYFDIISRIGGVSAPGITH